MFSPFMAERADGGPTGWEEHVADITGGNLAVSKWRHDPDASAFDDDRAFRAIRGAMSEDNNDPQRLRKPAVEIAALLPPPGAVREESDEALRSLWNLFVSLAQQTPSGNIALLDLVVILDHLSASPRAAATVTVNGFEQLSRLHGLSQAIRDCMKSPYDDDPAVRGRSLSRFVNLNAFAALLWSYNLVDGRDFAIQQLRSAFEDRRSSDAGDRSGADARLMAAAQWAIHSCQRLYHLSVTCEPTSPEGGGERRWRPGARFKGRAGFSFQRWEFWQQSFEEAKELGNGGIEAKVEAGAASGMMEKVMYAGFEV
ncbi:hypothetical protein CMUS01_08646 [Colletotrichum musicola]|uniref:Uncharacterized protein n=1 Tax=Colletotrichum musicola TaxID=2175873 RepID=A0A8H6ND73_9PEZI|nr:hypothetical protein CMUS01_08646 [Colletotrichum musicola]